MASTPRQNGPHERVPAPLLVLVGAAAAVVVLAGVHQTRGILGPSFLALVFVVSLQPLRGALGLRGAPEWARVAALLVAAYAILLGLVAGIALSVAQLAVLMPRYSTKLADLASQAAGVLEPVGVTAEEVTGFVTSLDVTSFLGELRPVLGSATSAVSGVVLVVVLILFLAIEDATAVRRIEALPLRPELVDALRTFAARTRRYVVVSTAFGLVVAAVDVVVLYVLGVPVPLVWGLLAFVTNYIPNVGFVLGLAPPALIALLQGGPAPMAATIVAYSLVNFVIQSLIQPKIVGDAVGLSVTVTFLSLVFWAFVMGPLGGLLAVPLTLFVKALFIDANPSARWLAALIGDEDRSVDVAAGPDGKA